MKARIINRRLGLSGKNIPFEKESLYGLIPGEFVIQLGDGRENGTIKTEVLGVPFEYVGSIVCNFRQDPEKMFAFKLPYEDLDGSDLFVLYGDTGHEIFTEYITNLKTGDTMILWIKPVFTKVPEGVQITKIKPDSYLIPQKMTELLPIIEECISKGAKLYANVSGGKDGQAMTEWMINHGLPIESLLHMDLGRAEWAESLVQCKKLRNKHSIPLVVRRRSDGLDLVDLMKLRLETLRGTGSPFWPSSAARYCTSDMKRDVANKFYTETGHDFIISCEGIRAAESTKRAKKEPLSIRRKASSTYYKGMTVWEAIANFKPGKKLKLDYYPIFQHSIDQVWDLGGNSGEELIRYRIEYKETGIVNSNWNFSPVYVYGNDRVSCVICVLASENDLRVGMDHHPELRQEYIQMEVDGNCSFREGFSLASLI